MIHRTEHGPVATLRIEHGKANALDLELARDLGEAFGAEATSASRAVVVTGSGNIFSAGVDLFRLRDGGAAYAAEFLPAMERAFERMAFLPKPLVVAANGHAIAGGGVVLCLGDHRLVSEGPWRIGVPELLVGVPFPNLAFEIVRASLPSRHLREAVYEARLYDPDEARERGFVDEVVPADSLMERAKVRAEALAKIPAESFRISKRQMRAPLEARWRAALDGLEGRVRDAWASDEVLDAVRRYVADHLET